MLSFPKPQSLDPKSKLRRCKEKGCGKVFVKSARSARFCGECWQARYDKRAAVRKARRKRDGDYPKPESQFWNKKARGKRLEVVGAKCEVCGMTEKDCTAQFGCGLTGDHLLPARFVKQHGLGDPHLDLNVVMTCSACCGKKTAAEVKLFRGDVIGFVKDLKAGGWNMPELEMVMSYYNFYPSAIEYLFH